MSARNRSSIEKPEMKLTTKSQIETRLPEQMQNGSTNVHCTSVRPTIAKTNVACCHLPAHQLPLAICFDFC
jgi:hypothetical protein